MPYLPRQKEGPMKIDLTPSQVAMVREALRSYADGLTVNRWLAEAGEYLLLIDKLYPQEEEVKCE